MSWVWTGVGSYGLGVGLVLIALAVVIFRATPHLLQVRLLVLVLAVEGVGTVAAIGLMYLTSSATATYAWQVAGLMFMCASPTAYLLFIGTLPSRLASPLRSRIGRGVLAALLVGLPLFILVDRNEMILAVVPGSYSPWDVEFSTTMLLLLPGYALVVSLYGLLVGIDAFRHSPRGSEQRRQMAYLLAAFGVRDAGLVAVYGFAIASVFGVEIPGTTLMYFVAVAPSTVDLAWAILLSYAVLRVHLLEIDLKLKLAIKGTTLTSFFLVAFLIVDQLVQNLTSQFLGILGGAVTAGLLLFALRPLQSAADRLANAAMPHVQASAAYLEARKGQVFSAALEGALQDGTITDKERNTLTRLQLELGIANVEAHALEVHVRTALGYPAGVARA